ncbi:hypothetical protein GCM10010399_34010 [Dactylosporangium fulvum]|uniref:Uncharacterized protein n=1 Tax=Dactylosporangium fulvum TaxID=53359 RepID=A0ABY5W257_9ACTN|nr:hypothetical protein [Dactylosporangium fulvum]UWP83191.1 hypothetical protein Dfulv_02460 [Dactylosporangium fulvum]
MTSLTSIARALAVRDQTAQRITTVRHTHISRRPLVFIPLALAGEANAPLAAMVGDRPDSPRLFIVPQPRNRDQRFAFAAELGRLMVSYVDSFARQAEDVRGRSRFADAPQLLVPNPGGIGFVRLFGRSTRLRRTYGEYAVKPVVPLLGQWLTFFSERAEHPGSSLMLAMTSALGDHWATGQSAVEDANLAALLAWIDPPAGRSPFDAALDAEDPETWPPAGPATDPTFDADRLAPAIDRYARTDGNPVARQQALSRLETALTTQLEPTWQLMWRGVELLNALTPGASVVARWADDRDVYTNYVSHLRGDSPLPQARRDSAVAAARRLSRLERAQALFDSQRALDDPLVMAEYRLTGEAFAGTVVHAEPDRVDASGPRRKLRPHITVRTQDPLRLGAGVSVKSPARLSQQAGIVAVTPVDGGLDVVLELTGGMGRSLTAPPGSVPAVGERVTYSTVSDAYQPGGQFPSAEETPWTHGGPPAPPVPTEEDAVEDWS